MPKQLICIYLHPKFIEKFTHKVKQDVLNIQFCSMNLDHNRFIFYWKKSMSRYATYTVKEEESFKRKFNK